MPEPDDLPRKFVELQEKYDRLLEMTKEQAHENVIVARLARWVFHSRAIGIALVQHSAITGANAVWRRLETTEWHRIGSTAAAATLSEIVKRAAPEAERESHLVLDLARPNEKGRIRLFLESAGEPPALVVLAMETRTTQHRARNHLAAASLQAHLLREFGDGPPEVRRRAETIADLIQRAAAAFDEDPAPSR